MSPKSSDWCPGKGREIWKTKECDVEGEVETGVMKP